MLYGDYCLLASQLTLESSDNRKMQECIAKSRSHVDLDVVDEIRE